MRILVGLACGLLFLGFLHAGIGSISDLATRAPTDTCRLQWTAGGQVACEGACNDPSNFWGCGTQVTVIGTSSKRYECRCEVWTVGLPPVLDDWYWPDAACAESSALMDQNGNWVILCSDLNCQTACDADYSQTGSVCECP